MLLKREEDAKFLIGDEGDDFTNYGGGYVASYESDPLGCVAWELYAVLIAN